MVPAVTTFPVDDVAPAGTPLPTRPLGGLFPEALVTGGDPALPVLEPDGVHPLLSAVARAFAEHRPLVLSPDAVWLTIALGVARHVSLHPEELRPLLVAHEGRERLTASITGPVPRDAAFWSDLAAGLAGRLRDPGLFACDFSTSTDVDRTAGHIVALDAHRPYYSLWLRSICGIPRITLTGTPGDWRAVRARVDALAGLIPPAWHRSLAPILDEFVRAALGEPDVSFWQRIYKPADAYGGDLITGWVARFYPYLALTAIDRPNPLLDLPLGEPRDVTVDAGGPGVQSNAVPATLSRVIVHVNDGDLRRLALHAGLVGVAQDPDGALRPIAGWHLTPAGLGLDEVLDRIVREHHTTPPRPVHGDAPAEVVELYHRIGSARLFGGHWQIVPMAERRHVHTHDPEHWTETLVELSDGRSIAGVYDLRTNAVHWVLARIAQGRVAGDPADVPVLGSSLALLLDAALDSGGDVAHLETGRLHTL